MRPGMVPRRRGRPAAGRAAPRATVAGVKRSVAGLCVAAVFIFAGAGASGASGCVPGGGRVVASAGAARMYVLSGGLYGCLGTRRTRLGAAPSARPLASVRVALFALSPGYAGIDTATMGIDTFSSVVSVVDLRSGATRASAPATTPERRAESFVTVRSIAIDPHGTVAWIGSRSAVGAFTPVNEVHTL